MAYKHLLILVIVSLISSSIQDVTDNKVDTQEESPLSDVAKEILKEKNLENIGGMVNSFIQSGGAKQVMDGVMQNLASNGDSGQLLESLGSMLGNTGGSDQGTKKGNDEVNPMELLSGLGSIVGAMQGGAGGGDPAAMLQGLGSLLGGGNNGDGGNNAANLLQTLGPMLAAAAMAGNQGGGDGAGNLLQGLGSLLGGGQGGEQGGLNPELIGNMINMFANSQGDQKPERSKPKLPKKAKIGKKSSRKSSEPKSGDSKGFDGILSLASSLLGATGEEGLDVKLIFDNLPFLVKMAKSFGGPELKQYVDPIDDIISLYSEVVEKKNLDYKKLMPKITGIYKAYQEVIAPNLNLVDKSQNQEEGFDFSNLLNLASGFLNSNKAGGGNGLMDYLPMIMNTISSFTDEAAQERANSHSEHSWGVPPIIEKLHIYFDHFMNSDMGKQLLTFIQEQKAYKVFQDEKGNLSYTKFKQLMENHSFRRHWIKRITNKLVNFLQLITDDNTQRAYIDNGIVLANIFLKDSGFPNEALLDTTRPSKSITNFANFAAKKYLDTDIDAREYVEPVVEYTQELLNIAKTSIAPGPELADQLTDAINMEIIEPITRVNRAYRFAKTQPSCDRYVLCTINQDTSGSYDPGSLPKIRKTLYKGYSLIAGWFLTSHTGTSYWDIYDVVTKHKNCQALYHDACNGFYHEEIKVTTEYVHNEL